MPQQRLPEQGSIGVPFNEVILRSLLKGRHGNPPIVVSSQDSMRWSSWKSERVASIRSTRIMVSGIVR
jgi:hypothetical protein